MSTPIPIQSDMSDTDLRKTVQKDNDDRLKRELKVGQTVIDTLTIDKMTREDLINQVTLLRRAAGQTNAVNSVVTGFQPAAFTPASQPVSSLPPPTALTSASSDSMNAVL